MQAGKLRLSKDLVAKFPAAFHDGAEHLIVAAAGEKNLASIKFEKSAAYGPNVDGKVVWHTENDFGSSVKPTYEVGRDLVLGSIGRGAKIADLEHVAGLIDEYIIRLQIRMEDITLSK